MSSFLSRVFSPFPESLLNVEESNTLLNSSKLVSSSSIKIKSNSLGIELVEIPEGVYWMGEFGESESQKEMPVHLVQVPSFWMGKYEVTQAQWREVSSLPKVNINLNPDPSYFTGDNLPVEKVSWHEAVEFCNRLRNYSGLPYRLPSEAEWEYACRAGTGTSFYFGGTISSDLVNYNGRYPYGQSSKEIYRNETTPVGSFPPNNFGLYDMHGNVSEWCQDYWHYTYEGAPTDGSAWIRCKTRKLTVIRGGSWFNSARFCRSASRSLEEAKAKSSLIGFRVVMKDN